MRRLGLEEPEQGRELCCSWRVALERLPVNARGASVPRLCDCSMKGALHSGTGHLSDAFLGRLRNPFVPSDSGDDFLNRGGRIATLTLLRRFITTIRESQWRLCGGS